MANETVTKSSRFFCVSLIPDICKTPIGASTPPIPYNVIGEFAEASSVSPNVKSHGDFVFLHGKSFVPTVKGDNPGTAGGIKSGTVGERAESKGFSKTFRANGKPTTQVSRQVTMNMGNTLGMIYDRAGQAAKARLETLQNIVEHPRDFAKPAARWYQEQGSAGLHRFADNAMENGGKAMVTGAGLVATGAILTATGVGAPIGAPTAAAGGALVTAGTATSSIGFGAELAARALDTGAKSIMTGKLPDLAEVHAELIGSAIALAKKRFLRGGGQNIPAKGPLPKRPSTPGKESAKTSTSHPEQKNAAPPGEGKDGGKSDSKKPKKGDKPSDCCPKNSAPAGRPVSSKHPVHFGTGEEILHQLDFVIDAPIPLQWSRCYRSGSETEDWGLLGARWAVPYCSSILMGDSGIVVADDSGRAIRLPRLEIGQAYDSRKEGFILSREGEDEFVLTWRDGARDVFARTIVESWFPHGYQGINAMLVPGLPEKVRQFALCRSEGRDGRGVSIERFERAQPGEVLLRIRSDSGAVVEAMRDETIFKEDGARPRIGRVDEVRADGLRICHVRYAYEPEPIAPDHECVSGGLPTRCNLVSQTNLAGHVRRYSYRHHLLTGYSDYTGFRHGLSWVSLESLRERWEGSELDEETLAQRFPITVDNSYRARAVATSTADDCDTVRVAYLDADTTRVTEASGVVFEYVFDANWLATEVRRIDADGRAHILGRREWDRDGMLLADADAGRPATRYQYDAAGNVVEVRDALGNAQTIEYDADNQPTILTDALGHVTRLEYDAAGRISAVTDALGYRTAYHYDEKRQLTELIDAKGGTKRFAYDATGRLRRFTDCSGSATSYGYDAAGRCTSVTDALSQRTQYAYDALGNLTSVTYADGTREGYQYDAEGRLLIHTDAAGHATKYRYNGHGLPIERVDALGHCVRYRYDSALRLAALVNAKDETYHFEYDALGNLIAETGFDGKVTRYTYDAGNELTSTVCAGIETTLLRDPLGQLLAKINPDGVVRFAYDALGRMVAASSPHAQQRFYYDALGRLIEERSAYYLQGQNTGVTGDARPDASFVMTHAYDELGNRIQTVLPNGRRIDILRYGSGHWHGTLWQGRTVVDLERDSQHRETLRQFGAGASRLSAARSYDPQSRLTAITLRRGALASSPISERSFRYDRAGNLLETRVLGTRQGGDNSIVYDYDPLGRLLRAVQPALDEVFAFDPADNLIDRSGELMGNRLEQFRGARYSYDEQGNLHRREGGGLPELSLRYDADNRLVHAVRNDSYSRQTARYVYDAFSRRIAKQVLREKWAYGDDASAVQPTRRGETRTLFVWDGDLMTQEIGGDGVVSYLYEPEGFVPLARVMQREELQPSSSGADAVHLGPVPAWLIAQDAHEHTGHVQAWQAHMQDMKELAHLEDWKKRQQKADEAVDHDELFYYHCDHLGTPQELRDTDGRVVWAGRCRAWGGIERLDVGEVAQPLRFQGQYADLETGLHYNRYRYYHASDGRFLTQDPIGIHGGTHAYNYTHNPANWIDPLGLKKSCPSHPKCDPCASLPADILKTFHNQQVRSRKLNNNEIFFKYHGDSNRTGRKYSWLTKKIYSTERGLRSALAIRKDWGVTINKASKFNVPAGTWVCEGKAAAQGSEYPGKGYQAVVIALPRTWITQTTGVFNK